MSERASACLASSYCSGATKAIVPRQVRVCVRPFDPLQILTQAQVRELGLSVARQEDVVRFNVAVDQVVLMRAAKSVGHLKNNADGLALRDSASSHDVFREISPVRRIP